MDAADFKVRQRENAAVLTASGEVDLGAVDAFRVARTEALDRGLPVIVDLTPCEFIDSTGIACLLRTFEEVEGAGQRFALVGSGPQVRRVLELVGVRHMVPTFESLPDAIDHISRGVRDP